MIQKWAFTVVAHFGQFCKSSSNNYKHTGLYFVTTLLVCSRIYSVALYSTGVKQCAAGDEVTLAVPLVEVLTRNENAYEKTHRGNTEKNDSGVKIDKR